MSKNTKKTFEASISKLIQGYKTTGKIGEAKPKDMAKARQAALAAAFKEN